MPPTMRELPIIRLGFLALRIHARRSCLSTLFPDRRTPFIAMLPYPESAIDSEAVTFDERQELAVLHHGT